MGVVTACPPLLCLSFAKLTHMCIPHTWSAVLIVLRPLRVKHREKELKFRLGKSSRGLCGWSYRVKGGSRARLDGNSVLAEASKFASFSGVTVGGGSCWLLLPGRSGPQLEEEEAQQEAKGNARIR